MHRLIAGILDDPKSQIDHIDLCGTNNQKSNIRLCNTQQNCASRSMLKNNTTGMRGVSTTPYGSFVAHVRFNDKLMHLGCFKLLSDAGRAYDAKAKELFGEFARLNFPNDLPMAKKNTPPPFHIPGQFIHQTFIKTFKSKTSATNEQAETKFQSLLKSGEIIFVKFSGLMADISIYEFKK